MKFDHIGLITETVQPKERFVEKTRVWVTNPAEHPFRVEWIRFCEDSPTTGILREKPHIAYKVDDIEKEAAGLKVLMPPFASVTGHVVGFYETEDGAIVELMQYDE